MKLKLCTDVTKYYVIFYGKFFVCLFLFAQIPLKKERMENADLSLSFSLFFYPVPKELSEG